MQDTRLRGCPAGDGHEWEEAGARLWDPPIAAGQDAAGQNAESEPPLFFKIFRCRKCLEERHVEFTAGISSSPSRYEEVSS